MFAVPGKEKFNRNIDRKNLRHLLGRPPFLGQITGRFHIQRLGKTPEGGNHMNKFCENLGGQGKFVTHRNQSSYFRLRGYMQGVFDHFNGDEKSSVNPVFHRRSSSISSIRSSLPPKGEVVIRPKLTGSMSSTLCGQPITRRSLRNRPASQRNKRSFCSNGRSPAAFSISVKLDINLFYAGMIRFPRSILAVLSLMAKSSK